MIGPVSPRVLVFSALAAVAGAYLIANLIIRELERRDKAKLSQQAEARFKKANQAPTHPKKKGRRHGR